MNKTIFVTALENTYAKGVLLDLPESFIASI
jgi:hypothetical protein